MQPIVLTMNKRRYVFVACVILDCAATSVHWCQRQRVMDGLGLFKHDRVEGSVYE